MIKMVAFAPLLLPLGYILDEVPIYMKVQSLKVFVKELISYKKYKKPAQISFSTASLCRVISRNFKFGGYRKMLGGCKHARSTNLDETTF